MFFTVAVLTKSDIISHFNTPAGLARAIGITRQAVHQWPETPVPAEHVLSIYFASNGHLKPYDIRPDYYPDPKWVPPESADKREVA